MHARTDVSSLYCRTPALYALVLALLSCPMLMLSVQLNVAMFYRFALHLHSAFHLALFCCAQLTSRTGLLDVRCSLSLCVAHEDHTAHRTKR